MSDPALEKVQVWPPLVPLAKHSRSNLSLEVIAPQNSIFLPLVLRQH